MVPVVVFAKPTKVAPKCFAGPVRLCMWAFVILTIATGTCLFTAAAFRQPRVLNGLIFDKPTGAVAKAKPKPAGHPPEFIAQFVTGRTERCPI